MSKRPDHNFAKARAADLITERVGDELVVYDGQSSEAHCLSPLASAVFLAADGHRSPADLAAVASAQLNELVDVPEVERALAELETRGLVTEPEIPGISRRGFMQRSAAVGGAVMAGSMITSVVAPAYGSTSSGTLPGSFSGLAIFVKCGSTYYAMKWDQGSVGGPPNSAYCGDPGAQPGNCTWPPPQAASLTVQSSCLSGTTASIVYKNGVAIGVHISLGASNQNCIIEWWAVKCGGASGLNCQGNYTGAPNTTPGDQTLLFTC
jgi:hypothetical protein